MPSLLQSSPNLTPGNLLLSLSPATLEAALAAESLTAEAAVPSGLQEPGDASEGKEAVPWKRRICGSGWEWWERGKGIPLLMGLLWSRRAQ